MDFRIPEPCTERWDQMERTAEGRYCQKCEHSVIDLARLTRREAERRIAKETGSYVCVRLAVEEGSAVFRPEPKRAPGWAGGLVLAAALSAGGCSVARDGDEVAAIAAEEPCAIPPVPPGVQPSEPIAMTTEVVMPQEAGPAVPTAEQRALTHRKHAPPPPPPQIMMAGRMPIHNYTY
jgi:hypothetical protein